MLLPVVSIVDLVTVPTDIMYVFISAEDAILKELGVE